jgi:hypothetical protein
LPNSSAADLRRAIEARDPAKVLEASRSATDIGDYDVALRGFVWFHRNSLQCEDGWYGVRLSFALADWVELGALYEPAMTRYQAFVDSGVRQVLRGRGGFHLFHDVVAMLQFLDRDEDSIDLFRAVEAQSRVRAARVFPLVRKQLVSRGDYVTCSRYTDPDAELTMSVRNLLSELSWDPADFPGNDPRGRFVTRINVLLEILWGAGRFAEARHAADKAAPHLIDSEGAQAALRRAQRAVAKKRRASTPRP